MLAFHFEASVKYSKISIYCMYSLPQAQHAGAHWEKIMNSEHTYRTYMYIEY